MPGFYGGSWRTLFGFESKNLFILGTDVRSCLILSLALGSQGHIHPQGFDASIWIHQMNKTSPRNMLVFVHLWCTRHLKTHFYFSYCVEYSYLESVAGNLQNSQVSSKGKMLDLNLELSGFKTPSLCSLSTTVSCCGAGRGPALFSEHSLTKCNKSFTPWVFLWIKSLLLSLAVTWKKKWWWA